MADETESPISVTLGRSPLEAPGTPAASAAQTVATHNSEPAAHEPTRRTRFRVACPPAASVTVNLIRSVRGLPLGVPVRRPAASRWRPRGSCGLHDQR